MLAGDISALAPLLPRLEWDGDVIHVKLQRGDQALHLDLLLTDGDEYPESEVVIMCDQEEELAQDRTARLETMSFHVFSNSGLVFSNVWKIIF